MNQKEISELRRRFRPEKSAVSRIYGCFVNGSRQVVSQLDESLGNMPAEEAEQYLNLLKKTLSGSLGRNLIDIVFSTEQVMDSDEHGLLTALRDTCLEEAEVREAFYQKVIAALDMDGGNYLILLAYDAYDVPQRGKDDAEEDSETVFRYILCSVCPVKDGKLELGYFPGEQEFHNCTAGQVVSPPELGFLFPAFDDRAANLYNALYYARKPEALHQEFIDAVFHTEPPMSAPEQKEAFHAALCGALEEACSMEVLQSVHEQLLDKLDQHRDSKDPEPLTVTSQDVERILVDCGVPEERAAAFREQCGQQFGGDVALHPENLIDSKRFEIKTEQATISVDPSYTYLVETRTIDGRKYLLIPVEGEVEVNGLSVGVAASAGDKTEPS